MAKMNLAVERAMKVRGGNRTWTVTLDRKLIGLVEECKVTGDVFGLYVPPGEISFARTAAFPGKTLAERVGRVAGYIMAKVEG